MENKRYAFITGLTGMDGSHLCEFLLDQGYRVFGIIRRSSTFNTSRIDHLMSRITTFHGDMQDFVSLTNILSKIKEEIGESVLEIYNLAAQSHVKVSFDLPLYTGQVDALGTLNLLESIKSLGLIPKVKLYNACTSEMFGKVLETPQSETTPFNPRSPYAVAKVYSYFIVKNYREAYNLFACNGILFNHTSERRGKTFVEKKICDSISGIVKGKQDQLVVGNIDSKRDIGYSVDYIKGMYLMLQHSKPDDYVLATGETYTIRYIIERIFSFANIDIVWKGEGLDEVGVERESGKVIVRKDEKYYRPTEVDLLLGDFTKAKEVLGWSPTTDLDSLLKEMYQYSLKEI